MSEAIQRILVSIVGIPLILAAIWVGHLYFAGLVALVVVIGLIELHSMSVSNHILPRTGISIIAAIGVVWGMYSGNSHIIVGLLILSGLLVMILEMIQTTDKPLHNSAVTLFGIIYIGLFLGALVGIRESSVFRDYTRVGQFVILMFVGVWICDTVAYFFGTKFGKHRLFEQVSPKKSIEGSIAGFIGTLLALAGVYYSPLIPEMTLQTVIIMTVIIGVFGQIGDLAESWLKRVSHIKDSSALIPGHGGVLDRFDSLLFVAPLVYLSIETNLI